MGSFAADFRISQSLRAVRTITDVSILTHSPALEVGDTLARHAGATEGTRENWEMIAAAKSRKQAGVVASFGLFALSALTGCQVDVSGQTLPSPYWYTDDVQYFPAGPEFKLAREAARMQEMEAAGTAGGGPAPVVGPAGGAPLGPGAIVPGAPVPVVPAAPPGM
jgi:hypothetical protein